eukprot:4629221-Prymnesium_polylepis.1
MVVCTLGCGTSVAARPGEPAREGERAAEGAAGKEQLAARPAPRGKLAKSAAALHAQKFAEELCDYHNDNVCLAPYESQ